MNVPLNRYLPICLSLTLICSGSIRASGDLLMDQLNQALLDEDLPAVKGSVDAALAVLGNRAGLPDPPEQYRPVAMETAPLSGDEARKIMRSFVEKAPRQIVWRKGMDPSTLSVPLRAPAALISGYCAVIRAGEDPSGAALSHAETAAKFLIEAQEQAGFGGFPFPANRSPGSDRAMQAAAKFLEEAGRKGTLAKAIRNGWVFTDYGNGGLQFDNAECGAALLDLYQVSGEKTWLDSAVAAAAWAAREPLCTNWNYNSFSVYLLARAHEVAPDNGYLDAALHKARLGVIPGQLTTGPRAGCWIDPHNASSGYHYIMMRSLAMLAAVMPPKHPAVPEVMEALRLGLRVRAAEILDKGIVSESKAMEALLMVHARFAGDLGFMESTRTMEALDVLSRFVSGEFRKGKFPLGPRETGQYLEFISR